MSAKNANFQLTITKAQVAIKSCPSWHTGFQWNHNDQLLHSCIPDSPTTQIFSICCYLKRKRTNARVFHHVLLLIACDLFLPHGTFFSVRNIHFTTSSYCLFIDYSPRATLRRSSLILKYRLVRYVSRPNSRLPSTPIATHWDGETLSSSCSNQYPVPTADVVYDTPVVIFFHLMYVSVTADRK